MPLKKSVTFGVLSIAVLAAAGFLYLGRPAQYVGQSSGSEDRVSDSSSKDSVTQSFVDPPAAAATAARVDPAVSAIAEGGSLTAALDIGSADGVLRREAQLNLLLLASASCSESPQLDQVQSDGFGFDETRAWAIARRLEICAGFDPSRYQVEVERPNLMGVMKDQGWAVAKQVAEQTVSRSGVMLDVFTAGQLMMENDSFPFDEVMPGMARELGKQEKMKAWAQASSLATCDSVGGCGPGSFEVVSLCSNVGCAESDGLRQVLQKRTPPAEYQATMAMYAWLNKKRASR